MVKSSRGLKQTFFATGAGILAGGLFAFLIISGCAGRMASQKTFSDVQAMESQVRNYRDWLQVSEAELGSLEKVLSPVVEKARQSDFPFYTVLDRNLTEMKNSVSVINDLARAQKKMILRLQRRKSLNVRSKIPRGTQTFIQKFTQTDNQIANAQERYRRGKSNLVKIFKKRNEKLVFLQQQIAEWEPQIFTLKVKRHRLEPGIKEFTDRIAAELTYNPSERTVQLLAKQSKKMETIIEQLDKIENYCENIDRIAAREIGGSVY
ncbi:MAG: hypothetical protein GXO92_08800, partial [FCB group bacterium]|nr:hypothetical protein [FCB group bacterium]